jgi:hypothetical protein
VENQVELVLEGFQVGHVVGWLYITGNEIREVCHSVA